MKKTLVVMLALFLAIPAISYAGSATSRWDLTIGGDIKFDMGWADQSGAMSSDLWAGGVPDRDTSSGNSNAANKFGNQIWGAGETSLNFFIKGPDAWGAKTHAFILGDFTGVWGAYAGAPPANYNMFDLLIADIGFDWEHTSLDFGANGSFFGVVPTFSLSNSWNFDGYGGKGAAPVNPQVTVTERFTKEWSAGFGVMSPYNIVDAVVSPAGTSPPAGTGATYNENVMRNPLPAFEGKIAYSSDSCGKVGPWQLLAEVDGFYGQQRQINAALDHKDVDEWFGDFKFLIPIIPEKNGNKTSALYVDGEIFWTQGAGGSGNWLAQAGPPWLTTDYTRADPNDWHAATMWGVVGHGQFYFTDQVSFNAFYLWSQVDASNALRVQNALGGVTGGYQWAVNLMYDVNPAVRFVMEWDYSNDKYAWPVAGYKNYGSQDVWRFSAYYYF
jgi:hypothetical protein